MNEPVDHLPDSQTGRETIVPRPTSSDAIGAALASAFAARPMMPVDMMATLTQLNAIA